MPQNVIGYIRVSTEEQADSRAGLEAQKAAITAEAERRGWKLVAVIEDAGFSGKDLRRPGIRTALDSLEGRHADTLVVAKLDRLSRSLLDFAGLMDRATREKWALVALDVGVDTTSPAGEAMASILATFAQFERRLIADRTRHAMRALKKQGAIFGRPDRTPPDVVDRISELRGQGLSLNAIAGQLTEEGVPTVQGGRRWYASTVRAVLGRASRK